MDNREILLSLQRGEIGPIEAKKRLLVYAAKSENSRKQVTSKKNKIAIIGMSGRYPKANDMEEYWNVLKNGINTVQEIPKERFDIEQYYNPYPPKAGKTYCKWLGMLDEVEYFDPLFFNISPMEAEMIDPHQRIFLQEGYKAFEDAGYNPKILGDKKCGVYLGIMGNEYTTMLLNHKTKITDITGDSMAIASARISYLLNLKGPAVSVDTACSSSLVCTDLAFHSLIYHDIDIALVGGVTLYLTPDAFIKMSSAGMLAKDGKCKTFDNSADGFVPGEGVGALVLKRLEDAELDGDHIYGVIIASGINQDGKTNGLTAPSVKRQKELISEIYKKYDIEPESVSYVEMHGTGTKLGDPIELKAITEAFREKTKKRNYCAIGSVKSNLGHTSAASGIAGIEKVLLCMKNRQLVQTLHYQEPNEHFNFEYSPFYVSTVRKEWKGEVPRRACVSSFGFSGTNAHVVIEEYVPENTGRDEPAKEMLGICVLSAKNTERLKVKAKELNKCIEANQNLRLEDILYTLQVGREEMEVRAGFIASSKEELCEKLGNVFTGKEDEDVYTNVCKRGLIGEEISNALYCTIWEKPDKKNINNVIELWTKGALVNWNKLCRNRHGIRVSLPAYPFKKDKYWMIKDSIEDILPSNAGFIHPLIQKNSSNLEEIKFETIFTGNEVFLVDHIVEGKKILPASVYIEMFWASVFEVLDETAKEEIREKRKKIVLKKLCFEKQLQVSNSSKKVIIRFINKGSTISAEIFEKEGEKRIRLCECLVDIVERSKNKKLDSFVEEKTKKQLCTISGVECYEQFAKMNLQYGKTHQRIKNIYLLDGKAYVEMTERSKKNEEYHVDVGLLDAVFQAAYALYSEEENESPFLPFVINSCELLESCGENIKAVIEKKESEESRRIVDISIYNQSGSLCIKVSGFIMKQVNSSKVNSQGEVKKIIDSVVRGQMTRDEFEQFFQ